MNTVNKEIYDSLDECLDKKTEILGYFKPLSFSVHHNYNPEDAIEATNLLKAFGNLDNMQERQKFVNANSEKLRKYLPLYGTLYHERMHFWQYASTPFGYAISLLELFQTERILTSIKNIVNKYGIIIKIPILKWMKEIENPEIKKYLDFTYTFYSDISKLEQVLHGIMITGASEASKYFVNLHKLLLNYRTDKDYLPPIPQDFDVKPHQSEIYNVPVILDNRALGALSIIEGNAINYELAMTEYIGSQFRDLCGLCIETPVEEHWRRGELAKRYTVLWEYCIEQLRDKFLPNEVLSIFSVVSDLSLMAPIEQNYFNLCEDLFWEDIDPGWRFSRAIQYIKSLKSTQKLPDLSLPEFDIVYGNLTDTLCEGFDWPTPEEIAKIGVSLRDKKNDIHTQIYAKACKIRLEHPSIFAFPWHSTHSKILYSDFSPGLNMGLPAWSSDGKKFYLGADLLKNELTDLLFMIYYRHIIARGFLYARKITSAFKDLDDWNKNVHPRLFKLHLGFSVDKVQSL